MQIGMESNKPREKESGLELKYKKKLSTGDKKSAWLGRIVIWFVLILTLFPILSVFLASLSAGSSFTQTTLLPSEITFDNYIKVFTKTDIWIWLKNTMIISLSLAVVQLAIVIPAAFAFSKLRFKFRSKGLMALLILQMFPTSMALPAILRIAYNNNGMDKLWVVVVLLLSAGLANNTWLMKGYMDGIPSDLIEAAYVDGATTRQVLVKIMLPLIRNMILVIFLYAFIGGYSEFMISAALLKDKAALSLPVGMHSFIREKFSANWAQFSAIAMVASVPIVAIFLALQKYIAEGFTSGAVKG